FDSLVLHHPGDSRGVRMVDGSIVGGERGRVFAYVGGRIEEIEFPRPVGGRFRDYGLATDQVLIKKDFILSHPDRDPGTRHGRRVHVPAPVAGVVGARRDREGLVDILDRRGGEVIARIRHMSDIEVDVGDAVEYGQTLGIQSDVDTRRIHVHMEIDSRYYLQFRNYVDDLASGGCPWTPSTARTSSHAPCPLTVPSGWERPIRGSATCSASWTGKGIARLMADRWIVMASTGSGCRARCWISSATTGSGRPETSPRPRCGSLPRRGREKWTGWTTSRPGARRRSTRRSSRRLAIPITRTTVQACRRNPSRRSTSAGRRRPASGVRPSTGSRPRCVRATRPRCHWPLPRSGPRRRCWRCSNAETGCLQPRRRTPEARSRSRRSPMRRYAADRTTRVRDKRKRRPGGRRFSATGGAGGSERLEDPRRAHAGADAHRHHAVLVLPAAHAVDDGRSADRAGR